MSPIFIPAIPIISPLQALPLSPSHVMPAHSIPMPAKKYPALTPNSPGIMSMKQTLLQECR